MFMAYGLAVIWRSSFVIRGTRYFCLVDDAMISMRYAANFAHGHGLVWNPDAIPVEGDTNTLWVLCMAAFHLLPIGPARMSLCIQLTGALLLLLDLVLVRALARAVAHRSERTALAAVALTALYFPLDNWALRGSEVAILAPMITASALMAMRCVSGRPRERRLPLYVLLGTATLIREDMAVLAVVLLVAIAMIERAQRSQRVRELAIGLSVLGLFLCAQTFFRLHYYGDPLPNAYYLKLTGYPLIPRLARGVAVTMGFLIESGAIILVIITSGILARGRPRTALLAAVIVGQISYSTWVGGDAWEWWLGSNRYVSIVMPLVMVLAAYGLRVTLRRHAWRGKPRPANAIVAPVLVLILGANVACMQRALLLAVPPETRENFALVHEALLVRDLTRAEATIAVTWAGIVPYFAHRPSIDLLGPNDAVVAREPAHEDAGRFGWLKFIPGHVKWDYAYSIGQLKPDVVVQTWQLSGGQADLGREYRVVRLPGPPGLPDHVWYVREDTPYFRWDRASALQEP
jgi:hypothetical protein